MSARPFMPCPRLLCLVESADRQLWLAWGLLTLTGTSARPAGSGWAWWRVWCVWQLYLVPCLGLVGFQKPFSNYFPRPIIDASADMYRSFDCFLSAGVNSCSNELAIVWCSSFCWVRKIAETFLNHATSICVKIGFISCTLQYHGEILILQLVIVLLYIVSLLNYTAAFIPSQGTCTFACMEFIKTSKLHALL